MQSKHIFFHLRKDSLHTQLSIYQKSDSFDCVNFPFSHFPLRGQIIIADNWKASSHCLTPIITCPCAKKNIDVEQQSSIYTSFAEHKLCSLEYCRLGFPPHNLKLNVINKITGYNIAFPDHICMSLVLLCIVKIHLGRKHWSKKPRNAGEDLLSPRKSAS